MGLKTRQNQTFSHKCRTIRTRDLINVASKEQNEGVWTEFYFEKLI